MVILKKGIQSFSKRISLGIEANGVCCLFFFKLLTQVLEVAKMGDSFKIDIFFTPTFGGFTVITNISYSYCQVEKEGRNSQHQNKQEDTEVMRMIL